MTRAERREKTKKKLNQRKKLIDNFGYSNLDYCSDRIVQRTEKVKESLGYVKDGHVKHYICGGPNTKTNNSASVRNSGPSWARKRGYGQTMNYKPHDARQLIDVE